VVAGLAAAGLAIMHPDPRFRPDCQNCQGICCAAHGHQPSHGFPLAKPEDEPCRNLDQQSFRCRAFETLEADGYLVCRAYDCFGAGPIVAKVLERSGPTWPELPTEDRAEHLQDFRRLSRLQCLLGYVHADPGLAGHPLGAALETVIDDYAATGKLQSRERVHALLMAHDELVTRIVRAVGYVPATPSNSPETTL
jgi:hypothetical protein